jgi:HSP20 family protein
LASTSRRYDPFTELSGLRSRLDGVFDAWRDGHGCAWTPAIETPAIDVVRENGRMVVRADLPGIKPQEVEVEVEDDILTIWGEHTESGEEKGKHYVRRERRYGSFSRSMALPTGIDPTGIMAQTRNGVLEVTIPLPKEANRETVTITPTVP